MIRYVSAAINNFWYLPDTIETKTSAYTILNTDVNKIIRMNSSSTNNFTINSTTGLIPGQRVDVVRIGTGLCSITQGAGATVNATPGLKLRAQYSAATILCVAANTYYVIGDLDA